MRRVVFIFFILNFVTNPSHAAIEIYAAGKKFNSFEDYKVSREYILDQSMKLSGPVKENRQAPFISKQERMKLDKISYNGSLAHVVVDFQQNWQNPQPRFIVNAQELQEAIRDTMANQNKAALLISDPKKMRILSLVPQEQRMDKTGKE